MSRGYTPRHAQTAGDWSFAVQFNDESPQEVLLAQFSLYVHKGGLKPDSFHLNKVQGTSFRKYFFYFGSTKHKHADTFYNSFLFLTVLIS